MVNGDDSLSGEYSPRIPRYNLITDDDGRVRLAHGRQNDGPIIEGLMLNMSATGALISLRESTARARFLDEGEMIKLELAIPERGRFAFFATVVRLDPSFDHDGFWELGLVFRNLPSAVSEALDRYVTTKSKDYSHPRNFDFAASRGLHHAARLTPTRLMALTQSTLKQPLFWLAVLAFAIAAYSPVLLPKILEALSR